MPDGGPTRISETRMSLSNESATSTDRAHGLTTEEARARLLEIGPNDPAPIQRRTAFSEFVRSFANPLIVILLVASFVSAAVGEWVNATIIFVMVMLGVAIVFVQT